MLAGLEAACWRSFVPDDSNDLACPSPNREREVAAQPRILYSQLLRGTEAMLQEEEAACQQLRDQIKQVEEHNNDLPKMIQECQAAVARAMESAMRRRKDLRMWACNDLRAGLNDLHTRRSELKQLVSVTTGDVKREEQANKLRAKRLEDLRTLSTSTNLLPTGRVGSKTSTQHQLARLTLALAKNQVLQEAQRDRKAYVRARTEAIFDVRAQLRELNNERVAVEKDLKDLEEEAAHLKRAFTPRPDWGNLHDATVVTTAVDRVDAAARMRMGATRNKLSGGKAADLDEDRASEQRVMQILSSNWSTVAKVGAMAAELAKIRSRDHAGDTILAEQKKLKHLHKEIARLMHQLEAVKAQSAA
ncbi:hypothetical protein PHYSODRAFT_557415 [Phytophthora sojae]|uniref:Uncharacterized protein n=1 Tax=Phytophthora sojae (strain P6497) TaxID=1094619 RepID=G4ZBS9_PHYSP|nr:hypothetical protein PHYSODRAFT_557415 [Phytophthora sojae]EGZ21283.1 hypothetical protein PHYSODRAFT_557415 [Phytophthora sojae]|eukprot:XP_009524000.1 hypothetical protein PHYSODRAFT_557415 [Phytophthora sojae]